MSQPSSIDRLSCEVREALHGWLRDPAITQTEAAEQPAENRAKRLSRQARGLQGGCTKRGKATGKRFFLNPETRITTFSESRFGSRFGIPHYSSEFVGKIRISPCRQSSASAHAARSLLSCALWRGMGRLWRGMGGILPLSSVPAPDRRSRWQPVVKPRVAPRAARIAPLLALRPADKARPWSILDIFDRGATQFSRDASPLECSGAFATGCWALRRAPLAGLLPRPRTQYEPMLRKGNVLACISYHVARRSA